MMTTLTAVTPTAVRSAPLLAPVAALVSALLLSGCGTIKPEPLTQDEIGARVSADRAAMYRDQQPVSGPLTLSDAMARALKYNLDYRLKMMETALSRGILDISQQDMQQYLDGFNKKYPGIEVKYQSYSDYDNEVSK